MARHWTAVIAISCSRMSTCLVHALWHDTIATMDKTIMRPFISGNSLLELNHRFMAVTLRVALKSNGTLTPYITNRCGDLWTVDFTCAGLMPTGHAGDMNVADVIRVSLPPACEQAASYLLPALPTSSPFASPRLLRERAGAVHPHEVGKTEPGQRLARLYCKSLFSVSHLQPEFMAVADEFRRVHAFDAGRESRHAARTGSNRWGWGGAPR